MNEYFSNLASQLSGKENTETDFKTVLKNLPTNNNAENQFTIQHTSCYEEVNKNFLSLKNDCSDSGYDDIPARFIKPVADYYDIPVVHIINSCIDRKIFPRQWKTARVCPIPKVESPTCVKDYRPISILPVLSKIYERVILNQLCSFIERNNLYNETQPGFRKGHTTNTLLLKLRDDIKKAMSKSEVTVSILIDYSKAFDTIDHEMLLQKLNNLNFSPFC